MSSKKMTWWGLGIALTVIGSTIKIPAIVGSVGLDAFTGLVIAGLGSIGMGAWIAAIGHLLSALLTGFPLGSFHLLIALEMALCVFVFGILYKAGKKAIAAVAFWIGNALISPLPFIFIMDWTFFIAIVPSLMIGSALNVIVARVFLRFIRKGEKR
ncbi:ECF transporter S component [Bacillus sp. APMAM]|nr:ECF transporter S component [Bacillus sp. APMAM]RTZ53412.1 ECF transporter S component [Bacillus sp. SAJ1]